MDTLSPPGETKFVLKFLIQVSFHISIKIMNIYKDEYSLGSLTSVLAEGTVSHSSVPSLCDKSEDSLILGYSLICKLP